MITPILLLRIVNFREVSFLPKVTQHREVGPGLGPSSLTAEHTPLATLPLLCLLSHLSASH